MTVEEIAMARMLSAINNYDEALLQLRFATSELGQFADPILTRQATEYAMQALQDCLKMGLTGEE